MCLAFIAIGQNPQYPLLLLFNRDEGYNRSSLVAHWWEDLPVFAGRDLHKGGTWAAVDRSGKFAMLRGCFSSVRIALHAHFTRKAARNV